MCEDKDEHYYIYIYVENLKVVAKDPHRWIAFIEESFMLKVVGSPRYYLGNDFN